VFSGRDLLHNLTFANQLTFLRLVSIPFFVLSLLGNRPGLALGLFVAAAVTDTLDGIIARVLKQKTALGAYLDPAADKLLMTCAIVCLTLPDHIRVAPQFVLLNRIPLWLTLLAVFRDLIIVLTVLALYVTYRITRFPPTVLGKLMTLSEVLLVSLILLYNTRGIESVFIVPLAVWVSLSFTLASGFHYIYRTSVMLRAKEAETRLAGAATGASLAAEEGRQAGRPL
jgi:cardiolipin synthase